GAVDALTASGGPVQAPLFLARGLLKEAFVASFAATSVILNPLKVALYGSMGYVDAGDAGLAAALSAAGLLGVLAGRSLLRRISPEAFHRLALGFLVLLALKLLVLG
ncbi:MAG: hypothetical protein FJ098_10110, partial [Deltaproteobacteria bacterium]|nr:hypothetical protein [Deltaproteobacteria bacterium]